jgi:hypothetical protein
VKTITLQIGNSDNKLTQIEWSAYARAVHALVEHYAANIYYHGFPAGDAPWQNACWVFDIEEDATLKELLTKGREFFDQEAIAWTEGVTVMI